MPFFPIREGNTPGHDEKWWLDQDISPTGKGFRVQRKKQEAAHIFGFKERD